MSQQSTPVNISVDLPIDQAIHECERELQVRSRCYAKWVKEGKLTQFEATERYNRLAAAIAYLQVHQVGLDAQAEKVLDMTVAATA